VHHVWLELLRQLMRMMSCEKERTYERLILPRSRA